MHPWKDRTDLKVEAPIVNDNEFQRLAILYLEDAIDVRQLETLGRELSGSPERVGQFNDLRLLVGLIHEHGQNSQASIDGDLNAGDMRIRGWKPATSQTSGTWNPKARYRIATALASIAVAFLMVITVFPRETKKNLIAELVSSEDAAWESSLPTSVGAELPPGVLQLKSGIATIRFLSGAKVTLEAPAILELVDPTRGRLMAGKATIDVPEPAIGFVMETPDSYAIDHGTQFSMNVDGAAKRSSFNVIEGKISVHVTSTGEKTMLTGQGKSATVTAGLLVTLDSPLPGIDTEPTPNLLTIGTNGREGTAIRNDKRKYIKPKFLTVNRLFKQEWERRSFFAFDLSGVDFGAVQSVSLQLNLVPFPYGFFSSLPPMNRYAVYGLTNSEKADWENECLREDSPGPEDGERLGTFEIARSQQRGRYGIAKGLLLEFLSRHQQSEVTFLVVGESMPIRKGDVPCHAFAGQTHPEANGPQLEFVYSETE